MNGVLTTTACLEYAEHPSVAALLMFFAKRSRFNLISSDGTETTIKPVPGS